MHRVHTVKEQLTILIAMTRLFKYRMRLGMFDPPSSQPYVTQYTADIVNTPANQYPADYVNQISYGDMSMRTTPGRTYKFYTGKPVFSFGDGLSYTTFTMKWMSSLKNMVFTSEQLKRLGDIKYEVKVTNTGRLGGSVPVLAYVTSNVPGAPQKELFGFQKVYLEPGKSANLFFSTPPEVFSTVDVKGNREVKRGEFMIQIADLKDIVFIK